VPAEIAWSPLAISRLQQIRSYLAEDKPEAAERPAFRMVAIVETLRHHPHLGRAGAESGLRELVIGGTPDIVGYKLHRDRVAITTIWHDAQRG
jgi:toxin ParE1/3/4